MKSKIITVMKKELSRFFGDKRTLFSSVFLPGIMIYVLYSFMGSAMENLFTADEDYRYLVQTVNAPAFFASLDEAGFQMEEIGTDRIEESKNMITERELDLLAIFPEDFESAVVEYEAASGEAAPRVELYYNSADTESDTAYIIAMEALTGYENVLANRFDINPGEGYDMASMEDAAGFMFSSLMPLLLMMFLFSGCMAVAPESIAGEKERGTMATMLITPIKRGEIAVGKILALSVIALSSGLFSTVATMLAMPKLMGAASENMSVSVYGPKEYLLLAAIILSTVLLLVALIALISAAAKTVKEAQSWVTPLMIAVMFVGVTAMFGGGAQTRPEMYLIPVYNSVQCMAGVFGFEVIPQTVIITVAANLVLTGICGFVLTKMFGSEKVMFGK